jgi:hypothetical protein
VGNGERFERDPPLILIVARFRLVVGLRSRDVIELDFFVVLEVIDGIDAAAGSFFDRSAGLVFLMLTLLAPQAPRRGRRTEVR